MTDEEFAKEWPFKLSPNEIKLVRMLPHELSHDQRVERGKLLQMRVHVELWLGYFDNPTLKSYLCRMAWWSLGKKFYDAVRPPV